MIEIKIRNMEYTNESYWINLEYCRVIKTLLNSNYAVTGDYREV